MMMFRDRRDAGSLLAGRLEDYKGRKNVIILALPRGGVVVGHEIARKLNVPLDVLIVRKLGFPGESELAIGAVAETGAVVLNEAIISLHNISDEYIQSEISAQKEEIARRVNLYREGRPLAVLENKIVILVDDGVATGATMKAAVAALKQKKITRLVVALPVSPPETAAALRNMVDELICIRTPINFMAVGVYYHQFSQVTEQEVVDLLQRSAPQAA